MKLLLITTLFICVQSVVLGQNSAEDQRANMQIPYTLADRDRGLRALEEIKALRQEAQLEHAALRREQEAMKETMQREHDAMRREHDSLREATNNNTILFITIFGVIIGQLIYTIWWNHSGASKRMTESDSTLIRENLSLKKEVSQLRHEAESRDEHMKQLERWIKDLQEAKSQQESPVS